MTEDEIKAKLAEYSKLDIQQLLAIIATQQWVMIQKFDGFGYWLSNYIQPMKTAVDSIAVNTAHVATDLDEMAKDQLNLVFPPWMDK